MTNRLTEVDKNATQNKNSAIFQRIIEQVTGIDTKKPLSAIKMISEQGLKLKTKIMLKRLINAENENK